MVSCVGNFKKIHSIPRSELSLGSIAARHGSVHHTWWGTPSASFIDGSPLLGCSRTMATSTAPSTKDSFNAALQSRNNSNHYIAHLKICETSTSEDASIDPTLSSSSQQRKARYLILAVDKNTGKVSLNKAKRNANGSFSIGKDWDLNLLREVQVYGVSRLFPLLSHTTWNSKRPSRLVARFVQHHPLPRLSVANGTTSRTDALSSIAHQSLSQVHWSRDASKSDWARSTRSNPFFFCQ